MTTIRDLETTNRIAALFIGYVDERSDLTDEVLRRQAADREPGDCSDDACGDAYLSQNRTLA